MKYYILYVENTKSLFTYKSEEEYKLGEWCIVNFSGRKRSAVIMREIEEEKIYPVCVFVRFFISYSHYLSNGYTENVGEVSQ